MLVYHVIEFNNWETFPDSWGLAWFAWGWAAVDIFYVISGFVITLSALNLRADRSLTEGQIFLRFIDKRLRRIVPLHYLSLLIFIIIFSDLVLAPGFDLDFIMHLFFAHNLVPEFHRSLNAVNWTLAVEMQFYFALILVIRFVNYQNLKKFVIAAFLMAFAWRGLSFYVAAYLHPGSTEHTFMLATQLPGMVDFFACGMLIAFFARSEYFARLGKRLSFRFCLFFLFALLACAASCAFPALKHDYWTIPWAVIFPRSLLAILFGLLVALLCTFELGPQARKALAPLIYLGTISYGIYLFHLPIVLLLKDRPLANGWKLAITLAVAISAAAISWHFYEQRFLKKRK